MNGFGDCVTVSRLHSAGGAHLNCHVCRNDVVRSGAIADITGNVGAPSSLSVAWVDGCLAPWESILLITWSGIRVSVDRALVGTVCANSLTLPCGL